MTYGPPNPQYPAGPNPQQPGWSPQPAQRPATNILSRITAPVVAADRLFQAGIGLAVERCLAHRFQLPQLGVERIWRNLGFDHGNRHCVL